MAIHNLSHVEVSGVRRYQQLRGKAEHTLGTYKDATSSGLRPSYHLSQALLALDFSLGSCRYPLLRVLDEFCRRN